MSPTEFKYRFNVLFNNLSNNAAPGMNDYDISVVLSKAQLELIKDTFNPNGNKYREGFDDSAKRQADFASLIETETLQASDISQKFDPRSITYKFPDKFLALINESVVLTGTKGEETFTLYRQVIPLSHLQYTRLMSKPYKEPLKNHVWRLLTGQLEEENNTCNIAELVFNTQDLALTKTYTIRYVRIPKPIIVGDLSKLHQSLNIDGYFEPMTSELNPELHDEILQRAVEIAKASYSTDQSGQAQLQNQITIGQRSE